MPIQTGEIENLNDSMYGVVPMANGRMDPPLGSQRARVAGFNQLDEGPMHLYQSTLYFGSNLPCAVRNAIIKHELAS